METENPIDVKFCLYKNDHHKNWMGCCVRETYKTLVYLPTIHPWDSYCNGMEFDECLSYVLTHELIHHLFPEFTEIHTQIATNELFNQHGDFDYHIRRR